MNDTIQQTDYFRNDVLLKRPYIRLEWCLEALQNPVHREQQDDGRIRHWVFVAELIKGVSIKGVRVNLTFCYTVYLYTYRLQTSGKTNGKTSPRVSNRHSSTCDSTWQ
ncbi:hypothetical protein [Methylocucumis oryzae]|uniref:hypothetical protein n=1 Tax=Methylocucumis oryzae TaxID=1632867 RepID=UPI00178D01AA|nr:hypothetical protein [Methylocucumis oryzae]